MKLCAICGPSPILILGEVTTEDGEILCRICAQWVLHYGYNMAKLALVAWARRASR